MRLPLSLAGQLNQSATLSQLSQVLKFHRGYSYYIRQVKERIAKFIEQSGGIRLVVLLLIFAVLPTVFASSIIYFLQDKSQWLLNGDATSFLIFFGIATFTMSFALTPTTVIAILSGYFFGWSGISGVMTAYLVASFIGLKFGQLIYHYFVGDRLFQHKKLNNFLEALHEQEFLLIFFGRLSPIFPFAMMNIVFAALNPGLKKYLFAGFLGALPRTFLFFYLGKNVKEIWQFALNPTLEESYSLIPIILVVVSSVGIIWILRNALKRKMSAS